MAIGADRSNYSFEYSSKGILVETKTPTDIDLPPLQVAKALKAIAEKVCSYCHINYLVGTTRPHSPRKAEY